MGSFGRDKMVVRFLTIIVLFFTLSGCSKLLFFPEKEILQTPAVLEISYEDKTIRINEKESISAWYFPNKASACDILYLHGNAQNLSTMFLNVVPIVRAGYSVLAIDYRGFGKSDGEATIDNIVEDAVAANKTLQKPVIVFGQSMGGFAALRLLEMRPENVKGAIIDGSFGDLQELARSKAKDIWLFWPFQYPIAWSFPNRSVDASKINVPLLFIVGEDDGTIPPEFTKAVYDKANPPKELKILKAAGHTQTMGRKDGIEAVVGFIEKTCKK